MRNLILGLVATSGLLVPSIAQADQCSLVSRDQAIAGAKALAGAFGSKYASFCEPCDEVTPRTILVKSVAYGFYPTGGEGVYYEVKVNGESVDLAYSYVPIDVDGDGKTDHFENAAALAGCPADGVSPTLAVAKVPGSTKSDGSDEDESFSEPESGGCNTTGSSSGGAFFLGALGLAFVVGRRRRA